MQWQLLVPFRRLKIVLLERKFIGDKRSYIHSKDSLIVNTNITSFPPICLSGTTALRLASTVQVHDALFVTWAYDHEINYFHFVIPLTRCIGHPVPRISHHKCRN